MRRRALSLVLAVCLCLQAAGFVYARAEERAVNKYTISAAYDENAQALGVRMTLSYTNRTGVRLESVMFCVYANCLRREATLPYDSAALTRAFPYGYAPSGIEFSYVGCNGKRAHYAFQGENEAFMRVECALEPNESALFAFEYTLLLSENRAFSGCGSDVRLIMWYPSVCAYAEGFVTNAASGAARFLFSEAADFEISLLVPEGYACAGCPAVGTETSNSGTLYRLSMNNACECALILSRRFYVYEADGIRVFGISRADCRRALSYALEAKSVLERIIGEIPYSQTDVVFAESALAYACPGLIVPGDEGREKDELFYCVTGGLVKQYFSCALINDPVTDPFLISGLSEYLSLISREELEGEAAFRKALNARLLPALSITIPGGLTPDSYLSRFASSGDYDTVAAKRGAAVMHEMRTAMGRDAFLKGIREYYLSGRGRICTIEDFVNALDRVTDGSWGKSLIAWLYTIDEYVNLQTDNYD